LDNDASKFTLFFDVRSGPTRYHWRLCGTAGETLGWSENGYADKSQCEAAIESMRGMYGDVPVMDLTGTASS
jgi:uncharacterized protein YegP (UPF0339 family)